MRLFTGLAMASLSLGDATGAQLQEDASKWQPDLFGSSLCNLGDVNGDGLPDCAVGAPWESPGGTVRVFSGKDGAVLYKLSGDLPNAQFGTSIAAYGDLDGDGILDLAVGAPHWGASPGSVAMFSGSAGELIWKVNGGDNQTWFGQELASAGDVDGDGLCDVVVGARNGGVYSNDPGHAQVLSGRDGSVLVTIRPHGEEETFAWVLAGIGDVDGDHRGDIAVGSFGCQAEVFSGASGDHLYSVPTRAQGVAGLCAVWDLNEDGVPDWIMGQGLGVGSSCPSGRSGFVSFVSGIDGQVMKTDNVPGFFSLCVLGDLDSDAYPDYALGTDTFPGGGLTRILSGKTGQEIHRFEGDLLYRYLGYSLAPAGDLDGDGRMDLLIGACNPWTPSAPGYVQIRSSGDGSLIRELSVASSQ